MLRQLSLAVGVLVLAATVVAADRPQGDSGPGAWRSPTDSPLRPVGPISGGDTPARPDRRASGPGEVAPNAVGGSLGLPNDAGQVWRDYDISSYTARVTTTKRPEQAIIDWILLETGYEAWHAEPLGILSAGPRTLRVYHTPQMQRVVADVVERFTSSEAATYTFATRMVSVDSPSWRTGVQRLLRSVPVRTSGINAWVLAKEDAAVLMGELRRRSDFREHNSPYLMVNNGQSSLISTMHGRSYVREVTPRPNLPAGFEPVTAQIDEGFALDFSPLLSADRRMIDATIKCEINQVEKMNQVVVEIPSQMSARQRTEIDVPQMTHFRFHERFRWPVDQVLVIGLGVVALPIPVNNASLLPGVPLPMGGSPARADLLVFVDCKGRTSPAAAIPPAGRNSPANRAGY
ncbi:MAG: hypothetical protein LLG00_07450 [Planctomycetaceae bacterium]|nr:hypothetical protein [Planctomycetaceae bacterium]